MNLTATTLDDIASLEVTLAQLKRCIADNDPEDTCKWAGIVESIVADIRRTASLAWDEVPYARSRVERADWNERTRSMAGQA